MFGKNPIRSADPDAASLALQSAFYTLQGEGPYGGMPALFVRLAGCNLACHFCDTEFESEAENKRTVDEIVLDLITKFDERERRFVVLTGGEPLRQAGALTLIEQLLSNGTELVQIETAGTLWIPGLDQLVDRGEVVIVCSPKTPRVNLHIAVYCHDWKYIVRAGESSSTDGLPRRGTQLSTKDAVHHLYRPTSLTLEPPLERANGDHDTVWLSPMDEQDPEKNKANMEAARDLCLRWGYRLSLQVHKIVGVE